MVPRLTTVVAGLRRGAKDDGVVVAVARSTSPPTGP
jgi:hypothetical protein